jgi:hypothetical protein
LLSEHENPALTAWKILLEVNHALRAGLFFPCIKKLKGTKISALLSIIYNETIRKLWYRNFPWIFYDSGMDFLVGDLFIYYGSFLVYHHLDIMSRSNINYKKTSFIQLCAENGPMREFVLNQFPSKTVEWKFQNPITIRTIKKTLVKIQFDAHSRIQSIPKSFF